MGVLVEIKISINTNAMDNRPNKMGPQLPHTCSQRAEVKEVRNICLGLVHAIDNYG